MACCSRASVGLATFCAATLPIAGCAGAASIAEAETSCWERVLHDWSRDALGPGYRISCYQEALTRLPDDIRTYSSAPNDIQRAMLQAIRLKSKTMREAAGIETDPTSWYLPVVVAGGAALLAGLAVAGVATLRGRRK